MTVAHECIQAPVSLAGALQEYLNDPNFEQNRIEYKANKAAVEKSERSGSQPDASTAKKAEIRMSLCILLHLYR